MTLREFISFLVKNATTERLNAEVFFEVEGDVRPAKELLEDNVVLDEEADEIVEHSDKLVKEIVLHSYTGKEIYDEAEEG